MAKLSLIDLQNLNNATTTVTNINANSTAIEEAMEKTLSRDGTSPNQMEASLDMNSNKVINLPRAVGDTEPVRLKEFNTAVFGANTAFAADNIFANIAAVEADEIDTDVVTAIFVAGHTTTGDGGDAWYKYTASEPAHIGKIQSADGAWWEIFTEHGVNVVSLGVKMDGSTDNTAVWNDIIAGINANHFRVVTIPEGICEITAKLDTITANDWRIVGAGIRATRMRMGTAAGTNGTFFELGTAGTTVTDGSIQQIRFEIETPANLNGTGNAIHLTNTARVNIDNCFFNNVNGAVKLGSISSSTRASRTDIEYCEVLMYAPAGGAGFDLESCSNLKMNGCSISCPGPSGNLNTKAFWYHSEDTADTTADSVKIINCEFNMTQNNIGYVMYLDGTDATMGNIQCTNTVFDRAETASIFIILNDEVTAGQVQINFANCIFDPGNSNTSTAYAFHVRNLHADGRTVVSLIGSNITTNGDPIIYLEGFPVNFVVANNMIYNRSATDTASCIVIGDGCGGATIMGNSVYQRKRLTSGSLATPFEYFVEFEGDASDCFIFGNDCRTISGELYTGSENIANTNGHTIRSLNNNGPGSNYLFRVTTSDATNTNIHSIAVDEGETVTIRTRIQGRQPTQTASCYYDLVGTFSRNGAGALAQIGSTTTLASHEANASTNAQYVVSGNNVLVRVNGVAAANIDWYSDVDIQRSI